MTSTHVTVSNFPVSISRSDVLNVQRAEAVALPRAAVARCRPSFAMASLMSEAETCVGMYV